MLRAMANPRSLAVATKRPLTRGRRRAAIAVAAVADLVQIAFAPAFVEGALLPPDIILDAVTAIAILIIVGFHWRLAFALAMELVPAVDLFPTWTALVLSLPVDEAQKPADALPPPQE
jgi:hypothetical protein